MSLEVSCERAHSHNLDQMELPKGTCLDTGPRRRDRNRVKQDQPTNCAVCGEPASGMYFGAMVCLPCKSFFIRCTKEDSPKFQCIGTKSCNVERGNRMRCQFCRFKRCLTAGMCRKEKPEVVEPGEGQELCLVCRDIANGIHFGVMTCEGCKKFFRRALKEAETYVCKFSKQCSLNPRNRNACRFCRYHRCLNVGMSREAIRMGRPKKVKCIGSYPYSSSGFTIYRPQYSPGADSGFSSDTSSSTPDNCIKQEPHTDILDEIISSANPEDFISLDPIEIDADDINDILATLGQHVSSFGSSLLSSSPAAAAEDDKYFPPQTVDTRVSYITNGEDINTPHCNAIDEKSKDQLTIKLETLTPDCQKRRDLNAYTGNQTHEKNDNTCVYTTTNNVHIMPQSKENGNRISGSSMFSSVDMSNNAYHQPFDDMNSHANYSSDMNSIHCNHESSLKMIGKKHRTDIPYPPTTYYNQFARSVNFHSDLYHPRKHVQYMESRFGSFARKELLNNQTNGYFSFCQNFNNYQATAYQNNNFSRIDSSKYSHPYHALSTQN